MTKFYESKPCRNCGDTRRYVSTKKCPTCARAYNAKKNGSDINTVTANKSRVELRKTLAKNGVDKFEGKPCVTCGSTERYTTNNSCVPCSIARSRKSDNSASARWAKNNPEKAVAKVRRRELAKIDRTPSWADHNKINAAYAWALLASRVTGVQHHVDHVIPLQGENVSGLHVENNLQVLPWWDNLSKGNKF
jgi:hypothetical protein